MVSTAAYGEAALGEDGDSGSVAVATGTPSLPLRPPGKIAPNGLGFAPFPRVTLLGTTITIVGIGPAETVGIPYAHTVFAALTISPAGIVTTNRFGVPTLSPASAAHIDVAGIGPAETVGIPYAHVAVSDRLADTPLIARRPPGRIAPNGLGFVTAPPIVIGPVQTIRPQGIPPAGTYTDQSGDTYIDQNGSPYTDQHPQIGVPVVTIQTGIHPTGIASSNRYGTVTVTSTATISPTGIPSSNGFGAVTVGAAGTTVTIFPVGIASTNRFGRIGNRTIFPAGIASTNRFGIPRVSRSARWNVQEPYCHWQIGFPRGRWMAGDPRSAP